MVPPSVPGIQHFLDEAFLLKGSHLTGRLAPHVPPDRTVGMQPVLFFT